MPLSQADGGHEQDLDLMNLCHENPDLAHELVLNPLQHELFLKRRNLTNVPDCFLVSDFISRKNYNKIVKVHGTIIKIGPMVYKNVGESVVCVSCLTEVSGSANKKRKINECMACGGKKLSKRQNIDNIMCSQTIKIQDISNTGPIKTIEAIFEGKELQRMIPGDRVVITGIVVLNLQNSFLKENDILRYNYCLIGLSIEMTKTVSHTNHNVIDNYYNIPQKRQYLINNFCKHIHGLSHIKLGIILCMVGASTGSNRLNSHCLIAGDSGCGKSTLLKYSADLITPSRYVNGFTTSEVGLTACAIRQDKDWALEAGALVIADNGICCIDNFDALNTSEKNGLLEAMEQQTISIAKAGMNVKLNARGSVLAATVLKKPKNNSANLKFVLNMSTPLISRFDLIFAITKNQFVHCESAVIDTILDNYNVKAENSDLKGILDKIKSYELRFTHDYNDILLAYYKLLSRIKENAEINTIRIVEGISRLAYNHAKLYFREKVVLEDIFLAIFLFETTLRSAKAVNFDSERIFLDESYMKEKAERLSEILNNEK